MTVAARPQCLPLLSAVRITQHVCNCSHSAKVLVSKAAFGVLAAYVL